MSFIQRYVLRYSVRPIDNSLIKTYHSDDGDRVIPGNQNELIDGCLHIQVLTVCIYLVARAGDRSGILARAKPRSNCSLGTLRVTRNPDACAAAIIHEATKEGCRFT
jgi:hypothetical protein